MKSVPCFSITNAGNFGHPVIDLNISIYVKLARIRMGMDRHDVHRSSEEPIALILQAYMAMRDTVHVFYPLCRHNVQMRRMRYEVWANVFGL